MSDEIHKPTTGPLKKNLAQVEAMVAALDEQLKVSGIAEFVVERDRLIALLALMRAPLKEARDFLSDADVVVAITTGAGSGKNESGGLLVEHITTAIEQLRDATTTPELSMFNIEELGRLVWQARVDYCLRTGRNETLTSHSPWDALREWDKGLNKHVAAELVMFALGVVGRGARDTSDDDTGPQKRVDKT